MLREDEIEAIRTLVGPIDIEEAKADPGVFNKAVEKGIGKILAHYQVTFIPVAVKMVLVPKKKEAV